MKGVRFYLEHESPAHKRRGEHMGNVIAAFPDHKRNGGYEALVATFFYPNSAVCGHWTSFQHLEKKCKRIPESKAREIHPRLFERLDMED